MPRWKNSEAVKKLILGIILSLAYFTFRSSFVKMTKHKNPQKSEIIVNTDQRTKRPIIPKYDESSETNKPNSTTMSSIYDYSIIIEPIRLCDRTDTEILAVIFVHISCDNFYDRRLIRETWGGHMNTSSTLSHSFKTLFVLGMPANRDQVKQKVIEQEATAFQDIIQYDFIDHYRNLTYKHILTLRWITQNCPQAQFIGTFHDLDPKSV